VHCSGARFKQASGIGLMNEEGGRIRAPAETTPLSAAFWCGFIERAFVLKYLRPQVRIWRAAAELCGEYTNGALPGEINRACFACWQRGNVP
jgi:hypothetical protein